jgi:hypothetical protein
MYAHAYVHSQDYLLRSRKDNYEYKTVSRNRRKDFFECQIASKCALHSIHNLLRTNKIVSENDMNIAAKEVAVESGDELSNHCSPSGNWSVETIRRVLVEKNYETVTVLKILRNEQIWQVGKMVSLWQTQNVIGFILHKIKQDTQDHFLVLRKGYSHNSWELVDSIEGISDLDAITFYNDTMKFNWTAYLVKKSEINIKL